MKVCVLIPSPEYRKYAGARIRYARIQPWLERAGFGLELVDVGSFDVSTATCDVLVVSKCYDARSLIIAAALARKGCRIGIDLFDDYFSQFEDGRMLRFRNWLQQMVGLCDFALCSTQAMKDVVHLYRPGLPAHVMNDAAAGWQLESLRETLSRKLAVARAKRRIDLLWFGVGDNPNFPVGISDVAAFAGVIAEMRQRDWDVDFTILTNARALNAERLAVIERLPVSVTIEEWSEEREAELLRQALGAFLPVSAQGFSLAKSLNRAVTALTAGCQVLSVGYPLYSALSAVIYRDVATLVNDVESGEPRLSPRRLKSFGELMETYASAEVEAARLTQFLGPFLERDERRTNRDGPVVVVQGKGTNGMAHKLTQAVGGLSVASPFSNAELGYDVIFRGSPGRGMMMLVAEKARRRLQAAYNSQLSPFGRVGDRNYLLLGECPMPLPSSECSDVVLPLQIAAYAPCMQEIADRMSAAFGDCDFLVSDFTNLPVQLVASENGQAKIR